MKRLLSLLSTLTMCATPALAGPFGFDTASKQNPATTHSYCKGSRNFFCTSAPNPHPDFKYYVISFTEGIGTCIITALSRFLPDGPAVFYTQAKTNQIASQIKDRYGPWSEKINNNLPPNTLDERGGWMMALRDEGSYEYLWVFSPPIDEIKSIKVLASSSETDFGVITLQYQTIHLNRCLEAEKPENTL